MNKNEKDIYELLNEVEFDITEEIEIPIDDIRKSRIKNRVKDKIRKKAWWGNKGFIAVVASIALIITLVSPMGKKAIAEIKEKFFYNPGLGIVSIKKDVYVLMEPIMLEANGKEIVIKSITSDTSGISIGIWISNEDLKGLSKEEIVRKEEILNKEFDGNEIIKVITPDGDELSSSNYSGAGGGVNTFISAYFETGQILEEFNLRIYDVEVENIKLAKVNEIEDFENIGFNDKDNGLIIGGNKYFFNGETYISLWTDEEFKDRGADAFHFDKEGIKVNNTVGEDYEFNPSAYSGTGKEFVINKEVKEPININISKLEINYTLKKQIDVKVKIPKEDEEIKINKEIYIEELDEKIILKSIKNTGEHIEMYFDTGSNRKENTDLIIMSIFGRSNYCIGATPDNRSIILGIYDEDLSFIEKLTGSLKIKISSVYIVRYGTWNFTIE